VTQVDFAIITERHPTGAVKTMLSSVQPPTPQMQQAAEDLDTYLHKEIAELEHHLATAGLLRTAGRGKAARGGVKIWHAVGTTLHHIVQERDIRGARYRRWLWDAITNLHASDAIKRAERGRTRMHFEYCYRLAQFPIEVAERMNWGEWVYFFDSLTVRGEARADEWLRGTITSQREVDRRTFRRFAEALNRVVRKKDTSVLSDDELSALYQSVWESTQAEMTGPELSPAAT
jgi:hypothetical protein